MDTEFLVEPAPEPTDTDLKTVSVLATRLAEAQATKERLEDETKNNNKLIQQTEIDLAEALMAIGYTPPTKVTIGGIALEFTEKFRCGQLDNISNPEGYAWITNEGHGDLAKHTVTAQIPREMEDVAQELYEHIRRHPAANQLKVDNRATIAWGTLAAFCREQEDQGVSVPLDVLNVHRVRSVKVVS